MKKLVILAALVPMLATGQVRTYFQTCEQQLAIAQLTVRGLQSDTAKLRELARLQKARLQRQGGVIIDVKERARKYASRGGFLGIGNRKRWRKLFDELESLN